MIDIPNDVKRLFEQDSISKNFRVHFPNGESRDLVNADMVSESVVFTESINSSATIKFGLCETPTIEFRCYNIENIKGKEIECFIEIDLSSLKVRQRQHTFFDIPVSEFMPDTYAGEKSYTAPKDGTYTFKSYDKALMQIEYGAETAFPSISGDYNYITIDLEENQVVSITMMSQVPASYYEVDLTIESGPYDELPDYAQTSDDVPFPYYRVPFGVYIVKSCERDVSNNVRTVIGYHKSSYFDWGLKETFKNIGKASWYDKSLAIKIDPETFIGSILPDYVYENRKLSGDITIVTEEQATTKIAEILTIGLGASGTGETYYQQHTGLGAYGVRSHVTDKFYQIEVYANECDVNGSIASGQTYGIGYGYTCYKAMASKEAYQKALNKILQQVPSDLRDIIRPHYIPRRWEYRNDGYGRNTRIFTEDKYIFNGGGVYDGSAISTNINCSYLRRISGLSTWHPTVQGELLVRDAIEHPYEFPIVRTELGFQFNQFILDPSEGWEESYPGTVDVQNDEVYADGVPHSMIAISSFRQNDDYLLNVPYVLSMNGGYYPTTSDGYYDDNSRWRHTHSEDEIIPGSFYRHIYIPRYIQLKEYNYQTNRTTIIAKETIEGNYLEFFHKSLTDLDTLGEDKLLFTIKSATEKRRVIRSDNYYTVAGYQGQVRTDYSLKAAVKKIIDETDGRAVVESYLELQGKFGRFDRQGNFQIIDLADTLDTLYPSEDIYPASDRYPQGSRTHVTRDLWKRLVYEEATSLPYDRIECSWKDSNGEEQYSSYDLVNTTSIDYDPDDYQHYDLSNNYFIKNGYYNYENDIMTILKLLGDKIKDFQYRSVQLDMRALPYIEAGDGLIVITKDGGFTTYNLRHRITGIQALMDNIESR